jgi:hypothetical protein
MIKKLILLSLLIVFAGAGCTSIHVKPLDASLNVKHVCIQESPRAKKTDFVSVVREGFDRHGITSEVVYGTVPEKCEYVLTYNAKWTWDFAFYLSHAEIRIDRDHKKVGYGVYHLVGTGGLSMMKWQGTKTKMDPVIDELLKFY